MKTLRSYFVLVFATIFLGVINGLAQVPSAEALLPDDTIAVFTIADWSKARAACGQASFGQLWADPSMKPFRDKLTSKCEAEILKPLEKALGFKLDDYKEIVQGQITFACQPMNDPNSPFSFVLLVDSKEKSDLLKTKLADLKKRWSENGKQLRNETIRDVEFTTISFSPKEAKEFFEKAFPNFKEDAAAKANDEKDEKKEPEKPIELRIGQAKSLLLVGSNPKALEKILIRQTGGMVPPLSEQASFQKNYAATFKQSLGYVWVNFKPLYEAIVKAASAAPAQEKNPDQSQGPSFKPEKILPALGLQGLESLGASFQANADGNGAQLFLNVPESKREGLFKALAIENKTSEPPNFIPADAITFQRVRIDLQKTYSALENMLKNIDPSLAGMVQFLITQVNAAGKEKDPNFDFSSNFIGNLGDDIITYEKAPKASTAEGIVNVPSLFLLGSTKPDQLVNAFRAMTGLMPQSADNASLKETEFLGRKIYTLTPTVPEGVNLPGATQLNFGSTSGYVAFSSDRSMIEEHLRGIEGSGKSLKDFPGLTEASQKVGGMKNGLFGFQNEAESMRAIWTMLKSDKNWLEKLFNVPIPEKAEEKAKGAAEWIDGSLLPNYDAVAKYFGFVVYGLTTTPEGLKVESYAPTPAKLKK